MQDHKQPRPATKITTTTTTTNADHATTSYDANYDDATPTTMSANQRFTILRHQCECECDEITTMIK